MFTVLVIHFATRTYWGASHTETTFKTYGTFGTLDEAEKFAAEARIRHREQDIPAGNWEVKVVPLETDLAAMVDVPTQVTRPAFQ